MIVEQSGTQSMTVGTEHSLHTDSDAKTFVCGFDLSNLVAGDVVEIRIKTKILSGSTARVAYIATYAHTQDSPNIYSPPIPCPGHTSGFEVTIKQIAGTSRSVDWAIWSL